MTSAVDLAPVGVVRSGRGRRQDEWVLDGPWDRHALRLSVLRLAVGPIGLGIAWYGASGSRDWRDQQVWIAIGVFAVVIALTGVTGWLRAGLRNVRHFERLLLARAAEQVAATQVRTAVHGDASSDMVVVVTGTTQFHIPGCLLIAGKRVQHVAPAEATDARLDACGMCTP